MWRALLVATALSCGGEGADAESPQVEAPQVTDQDAEHRERLAQMAENGVLLEAMTLQIARDLPLEHAEAHFVEILTDGEGAPRIWEAVELMPAAVEALVVSGAWRPQDLKEWKWLVITALHGELFDQMPESIRLSMDLEDSPTRWIAAGLGFTPSNLLHDIVEPGLRHEDPRNRAYTAFAIGARGYEDYMGSLRKAMDDPHPWARVNAIASLVRLGDEQGIAEARDMFDLPAAKRPSQQISLLFEALERAAPDPDVLKFVASIQGGLTGVERAAADSILILHAGDLDTSCVRLELPKIDPLAPEVQRGVRALSKTAGAEDIAVLEQLFHRQNSPTVTAELAGALGQAGHPDVEPLLKAAARRLPWNQGLLALASVRSVSGSDRILAWAEEALRSGAPDAGDLEFIRRIGWVLGAWGGAAGVEAARAAKLPAAQGAQAILVQAAVLGQLSR